MELTHIIGGRPFGVSKFHGTDDHSLICVAYQQDRGIVDSELNHQQQITLDTWQRAMGGLISDGLSRALFFREDYSQSLEVCYLHYTTHADQLMAFAGNKRAVLRTSPSSRDLTIPFAPYSGGAARTDLLVLELWDEELQPTTSPESADSTIPKYGAIGNVADVGEFANDLVHPSINNETTRRIQTRWRLVWHPATSNITATTKNGYTYANGRYGDGSTSAALALHAVDGVCMALPMLRVTLNTTLGYPSLGSWDVLISQARSAHNADMVDGTHASATPTANTIPVTSANGKLANTFLNTGTGNALGVDTVDSFHASATAAANTIPVANGSGKISNLFLNTGSGNGLGADTVDAFHASATAAANTIPVANGSGKISNLFLNTGSGNALGVDTVDTFHASATAAANTIPVANGAGKLATAWNPATLDLDTVDSAHANPTPTPNMITVLDSNAKLDIRALKQGAGGGIEAATVDGVDSTAFAVASHTHTGITSQFSYTNGIVDVNETRNVFTTDSSSTWRYTFFLFNLAGLPVAQPTDPPTRSMLALNLRYQWGGVPNAINPIAAQAILTRTTLIEGSYYPVIVEPAAINLKTTNTAINTAALSVLLPFDMYSAGMLIRTRGTIATNTTITILQYSLTYYSWRI